MCASRVRRPAGGVQFNVSASAMSSDSCAVVGAKQECDGNFTANGATFQRMRFEDVAHV